MRKKLEVDPLQRDRALAVYAILIKTYGERPITPRRSPMVELIMTMLSHRTTAANEKAAFNQMWAKYGSWEAIRDASVDELTQLIKPSTFPEAKAPNIKATLKRIIDERGEANIDFLRDLPVEQGLTWLTSLPGVGVKTATLVLLFCFAKPVIPVDTHVHRVSGRIGLFPIKTSAETAHTILLQLLPPDPYVLYNFHVDMLRHGQQICTWSDPRCEICPLLALCDYGQTRLQSIKKGTRSSPSPL
ncbi:MAG: endonuclease III [Anaerolineae bacterium]|nr:endonuclease III [Anaerolineae bacterium]